MTRARLICASESNLQEVARLMVACDCEKLPVVERLEDARLVGLISDRDITFRAVACGKNPIAAKAHEVMSGPAISLPAEADVEEARRIMERAHVDDIAVTDRSGKCCGVLSRQDIARHVPLEKVIVPHREQRGPRKKPYGASAPRETVNPSKDETIAGLDQFLDGLRRRSFPNLAAALRSRSVRISRIWDLAVRKTMPQMDALTYDELKDSVPAIMEAIAAALESADPGELAHLLETAPIQGLTRFQQHYGIEDTMEEDRLLRGVVVQQAEESLRRQLTALEAAALHATIDVMLQQSVISLVNQQKEELRAGTAAHLKYLSFLSHDLNNNLNSVTLMLQALREELKSAREFEAAVQTLDDAQQSICDTISGMRRLLDHAKLRQGGAVARPALVDLHALACCVMHQLEGVAKRKQLRLELAIERGTVIKTDRELLSLVLQNLVGNAIKYSHQGVVRAFAEGPSDRNGQHWVVGISDQGPGIAPEKIDRIFQAFERGEMHGQEGVGLGLAIASDAAQLLGAQLTVESQVGVGTTFRVALPLG